MGTRGAEGKRQRNQQASAEHSSGGNAPPRAVHAYRLQRAMGQAYQSGNCYAGGKRSDQGGSA